MHIKSQLLVVSVNAKKVVPEKYEILLRYYFFVLYKIVSLLHGEFSPFYIVVLHNIVSFFHSQLLIERDRVFVCYQIYGYIFFAAGYTVCRLHKFGSDALPLISPGNA